MRVRAIQLGYYGHKRRREGQEFVLEPIKRLRKDVKTGEMREITISAEQQFSKRWMEKVDVPTPTVKPAKEKKPVEASVEEI
jgi:hypothetical protein